MVEIYKKKKMKDHYRVHAREFYETHPGEWVLYQIGTNITEPSFHNSKISLNIARRNALISYYEHIPKETHRYYREDMQASSLDTRADVWRTGTKNTDEAIRIGLEVSLGMNHRPNEYVEICPFDPEEKERLVGRGIRASYSEGVASYKEQASCGDCGFIVLRHPSEKDIKAFQKRRDRTTPILAGVRRTLESRVRRAA